MLCSNVSQQDGHVSDGPMPLEAGEGGMTSTRVPGAPPSAWRCSGSGPSRGGRDTMRSWPAGTACRGLRGMRQEGMGWSDA